MRKDKTIECASTLRVAACGAGRPAPHSFYQPPLANCAATRSFAVRSTTYGQSWPTSSRTIPLISALRSSFSSSSAFALERYPPEVIAAGGAVAFLVLGFIDAARSSPRSSPIRRPITIAAMFVLSGALVRTGTLEAAADWLVTRRRNPAAHHARALIGVGMLVASAFMNNTPVVIVFIPIVIETREDAGVADDQAADPPVLHDHPRRHLLADRHVDQPPGRRRRPRPGAGGLLDLRDHARSASSPRRPASSTCCRRPAACSPTAPPPRTLGRLRRGHVFHRDRRARGRQHHRQDAGRIRRRSRRGASSRWRSGAARRPCARASPRS